MATKKILTRDFVLSFFAQFTFSSVFSILIPTIPIYLSRMGAKEAEIGVLVGALSVSSLVLRPLVGRALLKIPERRFMIVGTLFYTSVLHCLSLCTSFLAPFGCKGLSGDRIGLLLNCLFHIGRQYYP